MTDTLFLLGDTREQMRRLPASSVQTCVTSPPYFGLRDYGEAGQIGLETTPDAYVAAMVEVFREVRRVLRDDGTLWLNLGDSYSRSFAGCWGNESSPSTRESHAHIRSRSKPPPGFKDKDLLGIPWRVAFALQADGWYLRQDIIWHKPNPMPESVTDRCTKAHEYLFLLAKAERYFFDAAAIKEPVAESTRGRLLQPSLPEQVGSTRVPGKTNGNMKAVGRTDVRNRRSVWTVTTKPFKGAHFATFPPDLIEPCILAGSRPGDVVLDPFGGAGTTALVAKRHGRASVYIDLNPDYMQIARERVAND